VQGAGETVDRDRAKLEPGRSTTGFFNVDNRVFKAADPRYDRDGAISQGAKLGQAAGLKTRWHHKGVGACLNEMGERFVVADHHRDPARIRFGERLITILQVRVAAAKQHQLHSFAQHRRHALQQKIQSLLPRQPAYHAQQWRVRGWIKTKPALERQLVRCAQFQRFRVEAGRDVRIGFGIPHLNVDAVEDSAQDRGSFAQQSTKAHTSLIALDLAGIGRRNRRDAIGKLQARFQEADCTVIFDAVDRKRLVL